MSPIISIFLVLISAVSALIGFSIYSNPELTIEIQKKFYEKINWRIEPISMVREIRNTKIMGLALMFISFFTVVYIVMILI